MGVRFRPRKGRPKRNGNSNPIHPQLHFLISRVFVDMINMVTFMATKYRGIVDLWPHSVHCDIQSRTRDTDAHLFYTSTQPSNVSGTVT